jgi:hypothetical protein
MFRTSALRARVRTEVCLIQQDNRARAAVPNQRQVAFDSSQVKFAIERAHYKHRVHIRSDDLLADFTACDLARQICCSRQNTFDPCLIPVCWHNSDPIAYCRKILPDLRQITDLARNLGRIFPPHAAHPVDTSGLLYDASRNQCRMVELNEILLEKRIPS